jgi:hypothetical protein
MKTFILFISLWANQGTSLTTQEFSSWETCEAARKVVVQWSMASPGNPNWNNAVCVER